MVSQATKAASLLSPPVRMGSGVGGEGLLASLAGASGCAFLLPLSPLWERGLGGEGSVASGMRTASGSEADHADIDDPFRRYLSLIACRCSTHPQARSRQCQPP